MKSNLDKYFKQNTSLEKEGVWFEIENGAKFLIRRFGGANAEVKKAMVKYYKPVAKLVEKNLLDAEKEKQILTKAFIKSCILDWEGVEMDGVEVPYSFEKAMELFTALPELLDTLTEYAQDAENYREDVGN